jgi:hypothetical protein
MNSRGKSTLGYVILGALFAFAYGGYCIHTGMHDAALAQNETKTSVQVHKKRSLGVIVCEYSYSKDTSTITYVAGKCPDRISSDSVAGASQDVADLPEDFTAIMYFDPADLDSHSFIDFGAKSDHEYFIAKLSMGWGVASIALLVLGTLFSSRPGKSPGGIVVDKKGAVIHPDAMNSGQTEEQHYSYMDVSPKGRPDHSAND